LQRIKFTREQAKAIRHTTGHLRIIACPGSGKTEVVSQRIVRLIEQGVDPKTIVAFAFNEKAADELKARVRMILDERAPDKADFGDMFIDTIHSFCFYMLKEISPEYRSYDVLTDEMRVAFCSKGANYYSKLDLRSLRDSHGLSYYRTIERFLDSCDIMMVEDIDPRKLTDRTFASCYKAYRKLLDEEKYFDFSSVMHTLVTEVQRDRSKMKFLQERVKHLVVDEYQDVDRIQEALIGILSKGADSVCVVGDDDQNIYSWRGSDVGIIRGFKERYGKKYRVSDIHLSTNFRSTPEIIYTANSFIEHNVERLDKDMVPSKKLKRKYEPGDIIRHHFDSDRDELKFIAGKISELKGSDFLDKRNKPFSISYGDFAVLVRSNEDAAKVVRFLDHEGIPCVAYSGTSVFESPVAVLAMNCLAYAFRCNSYPDFNRPTPTLAELEELYAGVFDHRTFPLANRRIFVERMKQIRSSANVVFAKGKRDYLGDLGLQGFYFRILNAIGADRFDFGEVFNSNLAALSRAVSDYESVWVRLRAGEIRWFFTFVFAFARGHYTEAQHSDPSLVNAVNVLTIHKAKGLEFPVVFMPGFDKKNPPPKSQSFVNPRLYDVEKYDGTTEDERRVYYTAITRSERYLFITGSTQHEGKKKLYGPHPFGEEIADKFISEAGPIKRKKSGYPPHQRTLGIYPTSYTELASYKRCPQDFRLRNVYQFNAGVPVTFGYGTNIHNALNIIHSDYLRKGQTPTDSEIEKTIDRIFKLRYATKPISDGMKQKAKNVVKNYVHLHKDGFPRILQTEKRFEFALDQALISGQIDLLKRTDEKGKVTEVEIIDFKTDRNDSIYTPDYQEQLRFYAIACLESLGLKPKGAYVHHLDGDAKDYVDISKKTLRRSEKEVGTTVSHILAKKFKAKPSKHNCPQCDFRQICSFKAA
jgi:DNA helicase-2/ATP-dependent DNA helicase PcrA